MTNEVLPPGEAANDPMATETTTLVAGALTCVATPDGGLTGRRNGLFFRDVRVLSRLAVRIDGATPRLLSARQDGPSHTELVQVFGSDASGDATAMLRRRRALDASFAERLEVRVYGSGRQRLELSFELAADFAPLPTLVAGDAPDVGAHPLEPTRGASEILGGSAGAFGVEAWLEAATPDRSRQVPTTDVAPGVLTATVDVEPGAPWHGTLRVVPLLRSQTGPSAPSPGVPTTRTRPMDLEVEASDPAWPSLVRAAVEDLAALRVEIPEKGLAYLGAGAPHYLALFGRDTLLAAWESLLAGTRLGMETLDALARFQGQGHNERTLEQPGRIVHELRTGGGGVFGLPPWAPYYGTVDATPLFVMTLAELHRWGAPPESVRRLLPAARRALTWCVEWGDLDADGYLEYEPDPDGLANQGWKDSTAAMVDAAGRPARPPIALSEAQAYLYAAYVGLAELEERLGDAGRAPGLRDRASELRSAFLRDFFSEEDGLVAMALDGDKRPLVVSSSNVGHCLWTGLLAPGGDADAATHAVVRRLVAPDLRATWGLRTLASTESGYNPLSYHRGSIWPHDSAIGAAGLARAGATRGALRVADSVLALAEQTDWRLPELVTGLDDSAWPIAYPSAGRPQAWSAAAPLSLLRTLLGLEPDLPAGVVRVAPVLPREVQFVVRGIRLGESRLDLRVAGPQVEVLAAPGGVEVRCPT